jgi:hypothetical protein
VEIKAKQYVADSPQLRRQSEISKKAGKAQLIVDETAKVSKTLMKRMDVQPRQDLIIYEK